VPLQHLSPDSSVDSPRGQADEGVKGER
jgi:hypothetical protein